jgi:Methyltransferase domain
MFRPPVLALTKSKRLSVTLLLLVKSRCKYYLYCIACLVPYDLISNTTTLFFESMLSVIERVLSLPYEIIATMLDVEKQQRSRSAPLMDTQRMGLMMIDKDTMCPERPKLWFKMGFSMAFMLFAANMMLLLVLVQRDFLGSPTVQRGDTPTRVVDSSTTSRLARRLPFDFRTAPLSECPAANRKLTNYAPPSMKSKVPPDHQKEFALGGYQKIDKGSGDYKLIAPLITKLSKIQHELGIFGTVAELGVHHGRFTGVLFLTARENEKLIVGDLFEELQFQNVDTSGNGNRLAFRKGLESYGLNETTDLHLVHTGSTEDLPFDWHEQAHFEPFRIISVDAGHTAGLTFNDLEVAFCNTLQGGIVLLDDFFHNAWPGVTEGFFQFAAMGPIEGIYPFMRCEGKVFATNDKAMHAHYYQMLRAEPKLAPLLSPYAHEKRGSKVKYMMNGVEYLKCEPDKLERETMHLMWNTFLY